MSQPSTFVLVHGALFTSQGWHPLQNHLQSDGHAVVTLNVPGREGDGLDPKGIDLYTAVDKLCKVVQSIRGPIILVGHSQGGALITQAFEQCGSSVEALVFIAAVVPLSGETAFDGLDPKKDVNFSKCVTVEPENRLFRLNRKGPLETSFFADVRPLNPELADSALSGMVSEPMGIGTTPLKYEEKKFESVPKYYIETTLDQVVSIETQRKYQARTKFSKVFTLDTSHSPFLSKPKDIKNILLEVKNSAQQKMGNPNIELVHKYFNALKTGNMELLSSVLADDVVWHQPGRGKLSGTYRGKEAVFALFGKFLQISQNSFKIDDVYQVMSNGDLVSAILHFSAKKPGEAISMEGVDLMRIENTKIKEVFLFSSDQEAEDKFWQ